MQYLRYIIRHYHIIGERGVIGVSYASTKISPNPHTLSSTHRTQHSAQHVLFSCTAQLTFSSNNPDFEILKNFQVFVYRASVGNTKINFILFFEHEFGGIWTFNSENENDERNLLSFLFMR